MPLTLSDGALSVNTARELRCVASSSYPKELLAHSNFRHVPKPEVLLKAMVLFFIIS